MASAAKKRLKEFEHWLSWSWGNDRSTPMGRALSVLNSHLADHAFVRILWTNLYEIAPGVWRSNQPGPGRIARYARMGIRQIVSLRGPQVRSYNEIERDACARHGIGLTFFSKSAGTAPSRETALELLDTFETLERPFLIHCKSGADRTGLAAAMYLLHCEGATPEVASKQLSMRYWHNRHSHTGVLDHMIDTYAAAHRATGISLRDWLETDYDQAALNAEFKSRRRWS